MFEPVYGYRGGHNYGCAKVLHQKVPRVDAAVTSGSVITISMKRNQTSCHSSTKDVPQHTSTLNAPGYFSVKGGVRLVLV